MMRQKTISQLLILIVLLLLVACSGDDSPNEAQLPTLIQFVTATPEAAETATPIPTEADRISGAPTLPPTWTNTPEPTLTETLTLTASATITDTPTLTLTATESGTPAPNALVALHATAIIFTVAPTNPAVATQIASAGTLSAQTPSVNGGTASGTSGPTNTPAPCQFAAPQGFNQVLLSDPSLSTTIGCPVGAPPIPAQYNSATQAFERGAMAWIGQSPNLIYVTLPDGTFSAFPDTYTAGIDDVSIGQPAPPGLTEPMRGFGKVWRSSEAIRNSIGWAVATETGATARVQEFANGRMLYLPSRGEILVLLFTTAGNNSVGTWRTFPAVPEQFGG